MKKFTYYPKTTIKNHYSKIIPTILATTNSHFTSINTFYYIFAIFVIITNLNKFNMKTLKHFVLLGILLLFVSSLSAAEVQIKVLKPIHDGGAPVTGYIIEMKNETLDPGAWVPFKEVPVFDVYVINNLIAGHRYSFRVRTINKAGLSQPSRAIYLEYPLEEEIIPYMIIQAPNGMPSPK